MYVLNEAELPLSTSQIRPRPNIASPQIQARLLNWLYSTFPDLWSPIKLSIAIMRYVPIIQQMLEL